MDPLEIFKSGTWTDMNGKELSFSDEDVQATISAYDPALFKAPLVVGHPKTEDPAYGWVEKLDLAGSKMTATTDQLESQFADMVNAGRFPKVSASFFHPDSKNNPKPGVWYLRHVGFLGAAAPAVKGLKAASFSDDAEGVVTIEFADADFESRWAISRVFRNMRDWLLDQFGAETADRVVPDFLARSAEEAASRPDYDAQPAFSQPNEQEEPIVDPNKDKPNPGSADFAQRETALKDREQALADREKALAEQDDKRHQEEVAAFAEQLVKDGKLLPREKDGLVAFMAGLSDEDTVSFAEGGKTVETSADKWLRGFLEGLPERVDFAERGHNEDQNVTSSASFAAPAGYSVNEEKLEFHRKAEAYAAKHDVDYNTALAAVS